MIKPFIIVFLAIFLSSCLNGDKSAATLKANQADETTEIKKDPTLIEIADIPIHIDSTQYLIHPIGEYKMYGAQGKLSFGSSSYSSGTFSIAKNNGYDITGDLTNIQFQELSSEKLTSLTTKNIRIKSISFLRDIFDNTKRQFLLYRILDRDTNMDNVLDDNDIKSLYISHIDGAKFTKLTPDFQDLLDWKVIGANNRLYFRSIEDSNNNGEFDKEDRVHYQYVDFNMRDIKVTEYMPI